MLVGPAAAADSPSEAPMSDSTASTGSDPYAWLEDVTGDKPLAWAKQQNARTEAELAADPGFAQLKPRLLDPRFRGEDPRGREDRRVLLQLLEGRAARARPVAAHHARRIPQAAAAVGNRDRPRRARRGRGRELGLARRRLPQAGVRALPGRAVARRRRCRCHPRVRPDHEAMGQGRLPAARKPRARSAGSTATRSSCSPISERMPRARAR